jgi:hypothetical protein
MTTKLSDDEGLLAAEPEITFWEMLSSDNAA